jgi:hypothetical protein
MATRRYPILLAHQTYQVPNTQALRSSKFHVLCPHRIFWCRITIVISRATPVAILRILAEVLEDGRHIATQDILGHAIDASEDAPACGRRRDQVALVPRAITMMRA